MTPWRFWSVFKFLWIVAQTAIMNIIHILCGIVSVDNNLSRRHRARICGYKSSASRVMPIQFIDFGGELVSGMRFVDPVTVFIVEHGIN